MKLFDRLRWALSLTFHDLLGEESTLSVEGVRPLLDDAQKRLEALQADLAEATAGEKRAELVWREASAQATALTESVDTLLRAGQEEAARLLLERAQRKQTEAEALNEHYRMSAQVANEWHEALRSLQTRLEESRRHYQALVERERSAAMLEQLAHLRRDLHRTTSGLLADLSEQEERVAQREDRHAAREAWRVTKK